MASAFPSLSAVVVLGYHNNIPDWVVETIEMNFLTVLEPGPLKSGFQHGWVRVRALFLAADAASSLWAHMAFPRCVCTVGGRYPSPYLLVRPPLLLD